MAVSVINIISYLVYSNSRYEIQDDHVIPQAGIYKPLGLRQKCGLAHLIFCCIDYRQLDTHTHTHQHTLTHTRTQTLTHTHSDTHKLTQ